MTLSRTRRSRAPPWVTYSACTSGLLRLRVPRLYQVSPHHRIDVNKMWACCLNRRNLVWWYEVLSRTNILVCRQQRSVPIKNVILPVPLSFAQVPSPTESLSRPTSYVSPAGVRLDGLRLRHALGVAHDVHRLMLTFLRSLSRGKAYSEGTSQKRFSNPRAPPPTRPHPVFFRRLADVRFLLPLPCPLGVGGRGLCFGH